MRAAAPARWALALAATAAVDARGASDPGERFYRSGLGADERPVVAVLGSGVESTSDVLPCASCHLRSGYGSTEGGRVVPAVRWDFLGARGINSNGVRRAYDEVSLGRAIVLGIDPDGRPLSPLMPRYRLGDADLRALVTFVRGRGPGVEAPGLRDGVVHLAVVVTPDADAGRRTAMEAVLATYQSYANPRRRKAHAPVVASARPPRETPRLAWAAWRLHVWELVGPSVEWRAQLERRMASEPVFALVSGVGGATWDPVHRFCEEARVPCVLPNVDAPPAGGGGWWSLYFSPGVAVEARALARAIDPGARVGQVWRPATAGAAGAAALAAARSVVDLEPGAAVPAGVDALVLWTAVDPSWASRLAPGVAVWASGSAVTGGVPSGANLVQAFAPPDARARRGSAAAASRARRGVPAGDERTQDQTAFALRLLGHALGAQPLELDRELLLETIEHSVGLESYCVDYPHASFGPGQRHLSKGAYVIGRGSSEATWLVP